jgi:hypothetical protein
MSEAQFDEVFRKLEKVIKEIITKREYESITGQKFYDKFKVEFGILSSPALRAGIKLQKQTIIDMFNEHVSEFKEFCTFYPDDINTGVKTILNIMIGYANNNELDNEWKRYKDKSRGGKSRKSRNFSKNQNKTKNNNKNKKPRKWSQKYKDSINCKRPKGFSQKQHCKYGRKK